MNKNKNKNKKKRSGSSIILSIAAVMALSTLSERADFSESLYVIIAIALAVIAAVFLVARASIKAKKDTPIKEHRPESPGIERTVVNDTAEGHYLRQLDSFLKAGLIDKAEYKVLRERYIK